MAIFTIISICNNFYFRKELFYGKLPYKAKLKNGKDVKLPSDPWFLLGNYRLTLFTHVSGEYELISGQRSWARINHGEGGSSSEIKINGKNFSVKPSATPYDGLSAFVLNVILKNKGTENAKIEYSEKVKSHFKMIQYQHTPDEDFAVKYKSALKTSDDKNLVIIETKAECDDPLLLGSRDDMSKFDGFPPSLFMKSISDFEQIS